MVKESCFSNITKEIILMDLDQYWNTPFWSTVEQYSPQIEIVVEKTEPIYLVEENDKFYIKSLTTIVEEEINGSKK